MISLTNRQMSILNRLLFQKDYVKIRQLSEAFEVSDRTIRYDLDYIQSFLKESGISLLREPRKGIFLDITAQQAAILKNDLMQLNHYVVAPKEFIYMLCIKILLEQHTTLDSLGDQLNTSKNKVFQNMEKVEAELGKCGIKIERKPSKGISPVGNERDIRNAFTSIFNDAIVSSAISVQYFFQQFNHELLQRANTFIKKFEEEQAVQFSDDSLDELKLVLCYQFNRIKMNQFVEFPFVEKKDFINTQVYEDIQNMYTSIFYTNLEDDEIFYLYNQLKGAKVSTFPGSIDPFNKQEDAYQITYLFAKEVEKRLGINFKQDLEFINGLVVHLQVALHRLANNQRIENPLTEQVKYKYRFIYEITRKALQKIEDLYQLQLPEDEIAYIAMHLGASYERHSFSGYMPTALVVCGSGLATSSLLTTRLKVMLPELKVFGPISVSHIDQFMDQPIDFIISTVPLTLQDLEVVIVNPLLEPEELMNLKGLIFKKTYQRQMNELIQKEQPLNDYYELGNLIPADYIQLQEESGTWRDSIKMAGKPLLENDFITNQYVNAMIRAVEELGPYMVFIPGVAIVHASSKDGVIKDGASLLVLDHPIPFGDSGKVMVQVIIVICSTKSESDLFIHLVQILEKQDNLEMVKNSTSIQQILNLNNKAAR
ncbi:transcription antiterminator [Heyndrickxia oleronia]